MTLGHVLMPLVFSFIVQILVLVRKYKAGTLDTDTKWTNFLRKKVDKENCCCIILCFCSCTWSCYLFCPGKMKHLFSKCFHATGWFLSLFLSLPLVPVNKVVEAVWEIRLHWNEKTKREATEKYKIEKERLKKKLDNNTSLGKAMFNYFLKFRFHFQ